MKRSNIEWCDYTWNPVTGCRNRCPGCSARKVAARFCGDIRRNRISDNYRREDGNFILPEAFDTPETGYIPYPFGYEPTLHEYRMKEEISPGRYKAGVNIHIGSMGECFGPWIPDNWLQRISEICNAYPQHNYLFLTKHPGRYADAMKKGLLPDAGNCWYGTRITQGEVTVSELYGKVPVFISLESLSGEISFARTRTRCADWIIISGSRDSRRQQKGIAKEWLSEVTDYADKYGIPVFMNRSLQVTAGSQDMRREYPEQLMEKQRRTKQSTECVKCGTRKPKQDMIALLARARRGEAPKQMAYICRSCMPQLCREWKIEKAEQEVFR